ncbi:MAG: HPF/RaiA family ribosome-associated protein [Gemmataceae bacterium]|nr:HPF/RaiA family ribosome-associated protein [Gemmataceae bacterium]
MWLNIHSQGMSIDSTIRERIDRRLGFALGRFGDRIGRVTVNLTDLNGPRGGIDNRCRIVVEILGQERAVVEDTDFDLHAVIDRAADRIGQAVYRKLERARVAGNLRRVRPVPSSN